MKLCDSLTHVTRDGSWLGERHHDADDDMRFLCATTDQLITIGSDFPEYSPAAILERFKLLTGSLASHQIENIAYRNLERLFSSYRATPNNVSGQESGLG